MNDTANRLYSGDESVKVNMQTGHFKETIKDCSKVFDLGPLGNVWQFGVHFYVLDDGGNETRLVKLLEKDKVELNGLMVSLEQCA